MAHDSLLPPPFPPDIVGYPPQLCGLQGSRGWVLGLVGASRRVDGAFEVTKLECDPFIQGRQALAFPKTGAATLGR